MGFILHNMSRQHIIPFLVVSPTSIDVPPLGGDYTVGLASSSSWTASVVPTDVTVSPSYGFATSGQSVSITISVAPNDSGLSKKLVVTFENDEGKTATVTLWQAAL